MTNETKQRTINYIAHARTLLRDGKVIVAYDTLGEIIEYLSNNPKNQPEKQGEE